MQCPNKKCAKNISIDVAYCPYCGAGLEGQGASMLHLLFLGLIALLVISFLAMVWSGATLLTENGGVTSVAQAGMQDLANTWSIPRPRLEPVDESTVQPASAAQPTPRPGSPAQQALSVLDDFSAQAREAYRLDEGELAHKEGSMGTLCAGGSFQDFMVEAQFSNPYTSTVAGWDYGFLFRHGGRNDQFRIFIDQRGDWRFVLATPTADGGMKPNTATLASGRLPSVDLSTEGSNWLRLLVKEDQGYFFVKERYVTTLDLSRKSGAGDVCVATSFLAADSSPGKSTKYRHFVVSVQP